MQLYMHGGFNEVSRTGGQPIIQQSTTSLPSIAICLLGCASRQPCKHRQTKTRHIAGNSLPYPGGGWTPLREQWPTPSASPCFDKNPSAIGRSVHLVTLLCARVWFDERNLSGQSVRTLVVQVERRSRDNLISVEVTSWDVRLLYQRQIEPQTKKSTLANHTEVWRKLSIVHIQRRRP